MLLHVPEILTRDELRSLRSALDGADWTDGRETVGVQGASNVTNGCINLSLENAQQYFNTAIFGDPVEVTGTRIDLSEADGDIFDWTYDWPTWKSMSAIKGEPRTASAPATPKGAPTSVGAPN